MPCYRVTGHVTVSAHTYVEASSPEEAMRIASNREGGVAGYGPDEWAEFVIESADGQLNPTTATLTNQTNPNAGDDDE